MAYTDSLFQLGMDLTRSSTAQEEDHGLAAPGAHEDRKDYFIERDGVKCAGTHLLIDLFGAKRLDDLKLVRETLKLCADAAGANLLHIHLHRFTATGGLAGGPAGLAAARIGEAAVCEELLLGSGEHELLPAIGAGERFVGERHPTTS